MSGKLGSLVAGLLGWVVVASRPRGMGAESSAKELTRFANDMMAEV